MQVLVVDDDEQEFIVVGKHLAKIKSTTYQADWAPGFDEALAALAAGAHDVCMVDYMLAEASGTELIRQAIRLGCTAPMILLTGHGSLEVDMEALDCGAADFLAKDQLAPQLLEHSIRYAVERSRTLNALREAEARYSLAVEAGRVGVWDWDLETGALYIAPNLKAMLGYGDDEIRNHVDGWREHALPEDKERLIGEEQDILSGQREEFKVEYRMLCKDGGMLWFHSRGTVIRDGDGKPLRITGTDTDITERKLAEDEINQLNIELELRVIERTRESGQAKEKLEVAQQQLAAALEAMSEGFALFDADERLVLCNSKYSEIYPQTADLFVPGAKFEQLLREGVKRGIFSADQHKGEEWIQRRLEYFRDPKGLLEAKLADGRWIEIEENRTSDGGTVGIRRDVTARRQAEEASRNSQQLLQTVFDSFPHHLYVKNLAGEYVMMNAAVAEGADWTPEEGVGKRTGELSHLTEETKQKFMAEDRQVIETGQPLEIGKKAIQLADGSEQYRRVFKKPLIDQAGKIIGVVGFNEDITERVLAEERVRASERLLQTVFDTIPIAVYVKDLEGRFILANNALSVYLKDKNNVLISKRFDEMGIGTEEEVSRARETDRRVMEKGETIHIPEETLTYPDGEVRWRQTLKAPLYGERGSIVGLVGVREDITERKRAQERVRVSERLLRSIIDSFPHWITVRNTEGRYQMVNAAMAEAHNWSVEQYVDQPAEDTPGLIKDKSLGRMVSVDRQVLQSGERVEVPEYEVLLPSGEERIRSMTKFPLFDGQGKIAGVVGWSEDITERKRNEDQIKRQQLQLIHADKMASLGLLVAGVAHEINNPNTSIMLNVPLLTKIWEDVLPILEDHEARHGAFTLANLPIKNAKEEIPRLLSGIAGGSERVKHIVENLRNFGRLNEGRNLGPIAINDVVEFAVSLLEGQIDRFTDSFSVEYGRDIPMFEGDFQEIEQVVINLINNACQAVSSRASGISVATVHHDGHVLVRVSDEGEGIPEQNLNKIMDPFFTTRGDEGGTGLGLSVSFGIVKQHGGSLEFDSTLGRGTTATILLPALDGP